MSSVGSISRYIAIQLPGQAAASGAHREAPVQASHTKPWGTKAPLQASYRYDQILHQIVITLHNPETGSVIREIPSEQVRNVAATLLQSSIHAFDNAA